MSKTVFKVMVKIDTSKIKIKKYDDENLYNETTVVTKSEYLELMDLVKKTGFLPVRGVKIRFSDDTWDFTEAMFSTQYNQTKFHFSNAPPIYKDILKHYIFLKIVQCDVKLVTIDGRYDSVRRFAEYLFDSSVPIFSITPGFINMFFEQLQREKGLSIQTIKINVDVIKDFLLYFSEYNPDFSMEPFKSSILYKNFSKEIKASKEEGKTPNIPEDFYNGFIQGLISITKTERGVIGPYYNGNTMVMVACVLIIASQIGLRTGELIFLKANQLMTKSFIDAQGNKVKGCILNYETWKGAEFDGEVIWGNTVLNEMGQYAFNLLLDIFKEKRINIPKNFLVMTDSNNVLPLADTTFSRMYKQLLAKFADRLGCINLGDEYKDTLSYFNIGEDLKKKNISQLVAKGRDDSDEIFYPTITQFRVHTISSLIDKDVPLQYIKEMMSHLYAETTAGYTRLMEAREKPEEITAMYEDIAANNIKIIG